MLAVLSPALIAKAMLASVFIQFGNALGQNLLDALNVILALIVLRIWGAMLAEAEGFQSSLRVSAIILTIFAVISGIIYVGAI